ncbi:hypothetical protein [Halobellus limi]|uniref:Uncharacterized protein n=1 Tax=Halobellus limi TaxID=699433 RepID=A0A1H5UUY8_9EURY|nr:hypothetical protein [Halobellus limi]QCC46910.1 hypothetical protein DV707_04065 [Halobellus limi]SEF78885.1 hypothetical protein SAMN04488133_0741 [Halobellus limi]
MRFKLLPEPPESLDVVADARRAVPLVPASEDDCTARLLRRLDFPSRDVARTWLTFLRALELVSETPSGFVREPTEPTPEHLRSAFERRIYGAREVLDSLETDESRTVDDVFAEFEDRVPVWETHRAAGDWRDVWRERVERIVEWAVLLDLAAERDEGYVRVERSGSPRRRA